jgi:predicted HTH domain antitoxin
METMTVEVAVPKDLFVALGFSQAQVVDQMKEYSVLGLFQERRISAGKAAELLSLSKAEFVRLLSSKGVAYLDYTPEEVDAEFRAIDGWEQKRDRI